MKKMNSTKVNHAVQPLGIDDPSPVFSWILNSDEFGAGQSAYRIIISSNQEKAVSHQGDIWDTGKIINDNNYDIVYKGTDLQSKTEYFWSVNVWDENDIKVGWSDITSFETGIMCSDQWKGNWIGDRKNDRAVPMFRKEFQVEKEFNKARVYISGLGMYDIRINDQPVDDSYLNPANTQYTTTVPYCVYDITSIIAVGENAVGIELGNGFYNESDGVWNWQTADWRDEPKLQFEMDITYADGTSSTVISDSSWKCTSEGPTTANSIYYGEEYDARKEKIGWNQAGYDDKDWHTAILVNPPTGKLKYQYIEPMRKTSTYKPKSITKLADGSFVVRSPEMATGWAKLTINAPVGTNIVISYGETLNSDGSLKKIDTGSWFPKGYIQQDTYIAKGDPIEFFEPRFSYKGYEYIQIEGYEGELTENSIELYRISSDINITSKFSSSDELINNLHKMMQTTLINNFQGKPTDTPIWEKNGWTGDANVSLRTMSYSYDISNFMKYFEDIMNDCQLDNGNVPQIAPNANWGIGGVESNTPVWNSLYIFTVEQLYNTYGNKSFISKQYDSMRKLALLYIQQSRDNYGWTWDDNQLGDWVSPMGGSSPEVPYSECACEGSGIVGTAYVYMALRTMARLAGELGKTLDAGEYLCAMEKMSLAFNANYYNPIKEIYETKFWNQIGTRTKYRQTSNIVPLMLGIVPEMNKQTVLNNLIADIESKNYHLDTGMVGTKYILPVLTDNGFGNIAYKILSQKTYPSWGYWAEQGATSLWEMFESNARSRDHYFLGTYDEWFYEYLAGIKNVENGYKAFTLCPLITGDIDKVDLTLDTVRGILVCNWSLTSAHTMLYDLRIPVGSTASIYLPTSDINSITLNGEKVCEAVLGLKSYTIENNKVKLILVSGSYKIISHVD